MPKQVYVVYHYWSDDNPSVYYLNSDHHPSDEEAIAALKIDFKEGEEMIVIEPVEVVEL